MKQNTKKRSVLTKAAVFVSVVVGFAGPAWAQSETLADALANAYRTSGLLEQNRALLRAADEDVAGAVALLKPILDYTASVTRDEGTRDTGPVSTSLDITQFQAGIQASLLLYDGGASRFNIESLKETVLATRQTLISVEQQVLLRAVSAFLSVRTARELVALRINNVGLLTQELRAAEDRFEVGEVTRTDVAQAESRLAQARSELSTAEGDLQQAIAEYVAAVGNEPGDLVQPPSLPPLESDIDVARARALQVHPDLQSARRQVSAAELNILQARANVQPSISAVGSFTQQEDLGSSDDLTIGSIGLELRGPIYQGGGIDSSIRRAIAVRDAQRGNLIVVQRRIAQDVANSYAALSARRASLSSSEERIRAARIAFDGVREEATLGARTTLDVLDAEQELLDAQTSRILDEANLYVAAYAVLQATGRLTARDLRTLPEVQKAIARIESGGFPEAVVRMLVLLADARGNVRRDRLARSTQVLTKDKPFAGMPAPDRALMIHEQSLIVEFEPEKAVETLPKLLKTKADRELAAKVVQFIPGAMDEMEPHTLAKLQEFRKVLGLAKATADVTEDPLADQPDPDGVGTAAE